MAHKIVKVAEGMKIRNPLTGLHIPQEGLLLKITSFWIRRERDGDVTIEEPEEEKSSVVIKKSTQNQSGGRK